VAVTGGEIPEAYSRNPDIVAFKGVPMRLAGYTPLGIEQAPDRWFASECSSRDRPSS
jgi:hypothetical protein